MVEDKIIVKEIPTSETWREAKELFDEVKLYLDCDFSYKTAVTYCGRINSNVNPNRKYGWFRNLIEYGETQGYDYRKFFGGGKKMIERYEDFVKYYNNGCSPEEIMIKLDITTTKYYKLLQLAKTRKDIDMGKDMKLGYKGNEFKEK